MPHFISFEGGEGAGKSTQIRLIADRLIATGQGVLITREPGGSAGAEEIRRLIVTGAPQRWDPMTESLLLSAARCDHVRRMIKPALAAGQWVLCDRFTDSTHAYQGDGHGLPGAALDQLAQLATQGLEPDLVLLLDLAPALGLARARAREHENLALARAQARENNNNNNNNNNNDAATRFERLDLAFHERVRRGFLRRASAHPARYAVIDASGEVPGITHAICQQLNQRFGLRL